MKKCHHPGIAHFMGRVHVSASPLEVARKIRREYPGKGGLKQFLTLDRTRRRYALACALNAHAENRQTYRSVVGRRDAALEWAYLYNPAGKSPRATVKIPRPRASRAKVTA